jgi:predicted amidohydrolase YtcJ
MLALQEVSSERSLLDVIPAYTLNAAEALFEHNNLGSIETGKNPGLNLLSDMEPGTFRLTEKSTLRVLI